MSEVALARTFCITVALFIVVVRLLVMHLMLCVLFRMRLPQWVTR